MKENKEIVNIRLDEIIPNRFQPRLTFNEEELKDLADSIKMHGIIQPLVLRKLGDKYEIIAGERRYKASTMAGLQTVPAIIVDMDDKESAEVALVENLQRKDLTAIEEAQSYKKILDMGYLTQDELATRMGVSQPNIANKLRLLNLAIPVKEALLANKISERHARSLLNITDTNTQISMLNRIISERLTVRQTDDEINKLLGRVVSSDDIKPIDVDINGIKEVSQNVIAEHKPHDIDLLLKSENDIENTPVAPETPVVEETPLTFENPMDHAETSVENTFENPTTVQQTMIPEENLEPFESKIAEVQDMPINPFQDFGSFASPKEEPIEMPDFTAESNNVVNDNPFDIYKVEEPAPTEVMDFGTPVETPAVEETPIQTENERNITKAISSAREGIRNIENMGYKVDTEEFDFDDMYQIIIKIKKD